MILTGERERVAKWMASRIRDMTEVPTKDFEAIAITRDGKIIGAVMYTDYREIAPGQHDISMHCSGEPGWLTKATLRVFFTYPFEQLCCVRATGIIARSNKRALDLNRRLGFKIEGCIRDGFGVGKDGLITGMLKRECRWIKHTD